MAADGDGQLPISKISISSPALSSIIQSLASAPGDVDGLLFGRVSHLLAPDPRDEDSSADSGAASHSYVAATVTGHLCLPSPYSGHPDGSLIGWFSGRRRSPLRPSMRDRAVSLTLYGTLAHVNGAEDAPTGPPIGSPDLLHHPSVFLLLSFSATRNQAVHTHEDRAFVLQTCRGILETRSLHTVNLGPAFRAQYGSFSSESPLPWMPCQRGFEDGNKREGESSNHLGQFAREQQMLELSAEDFSVERLGRLVGPVASQYTSELEDLYGRRLLKLESLARLVEESSAKILVQVVFVFSFHKLELFFQAGFSV
ncbi:uncharacterized protein LOC121986761 [Zingiber officinale]|uniref:uncharacterized protein LOC121986761 n=1 Tax=Zingiber officinale TaxID=94328 RepID=UPI001C4B12F2|nr:uncharacterized protein LOC121986761 [Zingiber officinale]